MRTTYKLIVDPTTFTPQLIEIKVPLEFGMAPLEKRRVDPAELAEWTKEQFMTRMNEFGYGFLAESYIEENKINFKSI